MTDVITEAVDRALPPIKSAQICDSYGFADDSHDGLARFVLTRCVHCKMRLIELTTDWFCEPCRLWVMGVTDIDPIDGVERLEIDVVPVTELNAESDEVDIARRDGGQWLGSETMEVQPACVRAMERVVVQWTARDRIILQGTSRAARDVALERRRADMEMRRLYMNVPLHMGRIEWRSGEDGLMAEIERTTDSRFSPRLGPATVCIDGDSFPATVVVDQVRTTEE